MKNCPTFKTFIVCVTSFYNYEPAMMKRISIMKKSIKMSWKEPERLAEMHDRLKAFDIFCRPEVEIVNK